jgi:hypothetical protein
MNPVHKMLTYTHSGVNPGNKFSYSGTKLHSQEHNFIPKFKPFMPVNNLHNPGTKLHTLGQNFIPRYKTLYPGIKHYTHSNLSTRLWVGTVRSWPQPFLLPCVTNPQEIMCKPRQFFSQEIMCKSRQFFSQEIMCRFRQISPDVTECGCLKAIVLFKPGTYHTHALSPIGPILVHLFPRKNHLAEKGS